MDRSEGWIDCKPRYKPMVFQSYNAYKDKKKKLNPSPAAKFPQVIYTSRPFPRSSPPRVIVYLHHVRRILCALQRPNGWCGINRCSCLHTSANMSVVELLVEIWLLLTCIWATKTDIRIRLKQGGYIKGTIMTSERGRPFYAFRGIPYAEPPQRFEAPEPKKPWGNEVLNATKDGPVCVQLYNNAVIGQEDCLTLNVYTPKQKKGRRSYKAVMVFIHGGYFKIYSGTYATYPPERLMDSNIVLVTINYRLNSLGFLSTQDANSSGNFGLLDQTLALKWVKKNIKMFLGNPNNVTIFGQSAGGASVSYHILSPLSKGLFRRAIAMSGSALCTWAFESNPLRWAKTLATQIGCATSSTKTMVDCLRTKPASELVQPIPDVLIPFPPTIDGNFLRDSPMEIMKDSRKLNKAKYITGVVEEDGLQDVWDLIRPRWNTTDSPEELANIVLSYMTKGSLLLINMIKNQYLVSVDRTNKYEVARALIKAYSDGAFVIPHYIETQLLSKAGMLVYAYEFNYHPTFIYQKVGERITITNATSHGEELYMLFNKDWYHDLGKLPMSKADMEMVKMMTGVWSTFAKTGNPDFSLRLSSRWNPSTPQFVNIRQLNRPVTNKIKDLFSDEVYRFWVLFGAAEKLSAR